MKILAHTLVKDVLEFLKRNSDKEDLSVFFTFKTNNEAVLIPADLKSQYPEEMTIILDQNYENLRIFDHYFEIELYFDDYKELLKIPYAFISKIKSMNDEFSIDFFVDTENKYTFDGNIITVNFGDNSH